MAALKVIQEKIYQRQFPPSTCLYIYLTNLPIYLDFLNYDYPVQLVTNNSLLYQFKILVL